MTEIWTSLERNRCGSLDDGETTEVSGDLSEHILWSTGETESREMPPLELIASLLKRYIWGCLWRQTFFERSKFPKQVLEELFGTLLGAILKMKLLLGMLLIALGKLHAAGVWNRKNLTFQVTRIGETARYRFLVRGIYWNQEKGVPFILEFSSCTLYWQIILCNYSKKKYLKYPAPFSKNSKWMNRIF